MFNVQKGKEWTKWEYPLFKGYKKVLDNVYNFQVSNIIRDGTGKSKKLKSQKNKHYDLKNEERDESLVLFFVGRKNFNVIFFLNFEQIACTYFLFWI